MTRLRTIVSILPTVSTAMLVVKARARFIGCSYSRGPCRTCLVHRTAVLAADGSEQCAEEHHPVVTPPLAGAQRPTRRSPRTVTITAADVKDGCHGKGR